MRDKKAFLCELNIENDKYIFPNTLSDAIIDADEELRELEDRLNETTETVRQLTPECDRLDYILSVSSGALCGILDVFLVGKPGESPLGDMTDKWFANRIMDFAKVCGYDGDNESLSSAIKYLRKISKFHMTKVLVEEYFVNRSTLLQQTIILNHWGIIQHF